MYNFIPPNFRVCISVSEIQKKLEKLSGSKLTQEEIENHNGFTYIKEIEFIKEVR